MDSPLTNMRVVAAIAPLHADSGVASGQISQYLAGATLSLVGMRGEWRLVRGSDGYEGWMHRGYLGEVQPDTRADRLSLGCVVRTPIGERRALPLGARLGEDDVVEEGEWVAESERAARFPATAGAMCRSALHFFRGTSYQWGGVTPWGADCSGFTQAIYALHGVQLPRDAWQQAREGSDAGRDPLTLDAADLLFFSDRTDHHVTHVGMALGDGRMVHLALGRGGYAVENLADVDDTYVATLRARFRGARRIL
ncbi:MAG: C40 family peptidase [Gemmatimonadaceae bacterium]